MNIRIIRNITMFCFQDAFQHYDKDKSGDMDAYELRDILAKLGIFTFFVLNETTIRKPFPKASAIKRIIAIPEVDIETYVIDIVAKVEID